MFARSVLLAVAAILSLTQFTFAQENTFQFKNTSQFRLPEKKTADRSFWLVSTSVAALAVADVELSQACMNRGTCSEANPFVPRSRAKAYAIQAPFVLGTSFLAYHFKKHGARTWWLPQIGLMAGHGVGIASGLRFAF